MSDDALLNEFNRARSERAFEALVQRHLRLVFATALPQAGDRSLAERSVSWLLAGFGGLSGSELACRRQGLTVFPALSISRASTMTIHPSKAISDQYQMTTLELNDGRTLSGRIVSRDERTARIATELMRPTQSTAVPNADIRRERAEPVSTMPSGLLNALNEDELLDLVAYLVVGERQQP